VTIHLEPEVYENLKKEAGAVERYRLEHGLLGKSYTVEEYVRHIVQSRWHTGPGSDAIQILRGYERKEARA
jgi:hypothetical protein